MKRKIKFTIYVTVVACCFVIHVAKGQGWNFYPVSSNNYDQTDQNNKIESVGIGDFYSNSIVPISALHINTNLFNTINTPSYNLGEVFRTESPDITAYWRMWKYDNNTNQTYEYGKIYSADAIDDPTGLAQNFHFYIGSSFADDFNGAFGEIRFNTPNFLSGGGINYNTNRMRIMGGLNGFVGIGDYSAFTPQNLLHQHSGSTSNGSGSVSNYHQFTNATTGATASDGLLLGIADDIAIINNQEHTPLYVYTDNQIRLTIAGEGNVGIGTTTPQAILDVNGSIIAKQIIIENNNNKQDILALLTQLQQKVAVLEQQLTATIKN